MNTKLSPCWYRVLSRELNDVGLFQSLSRAIGPIGDRAAQQVLQLAFVQRGALARLAKVHFDHLIRNVPSIWTFRPFLNSLVL